MKWLRSLYDWVLHWADTRYGTPALFALALAESSFFPIPPDVLLIALSLKIVKKAFYYALICSIASIIGGILGYIIGDRLASYIITDHTMPFMQLSQSDQLINSISQSFLHYIPGFTETNISKIAAGYEENKFLVVFAAGFSPIPYKLITVSAGFFNIDFLTFVIASTVSRSARFFLVSGLIYKFGPRINDFINKYFNWLSLAFVILFIGFYFIFKIL